MAGPRGRSFLDHASTTPLRPEAAQSICSWVASKVAADPSRPYAEAGVVRAAIEVAREEVAAFLGVRPREVVFTSGGTEAANWASRSARLQGEEGAPILLAGAEHSCVRRSSEATGPVELIEVDHRGRLDLEHLRSLLDRSGPRPALVHCQLANHEVGTLQPVGPVAELCRERGVPLHVDACAAAGHVPLHDALGASFVSVTAHKLGGPPGIGALLLRRGTRLAPLLVGADQERARRAGTENLLGILGFAAAASALSEPGALEGEAARARRQRDALVEAALSLPGVTRYGDPDACLPHLACFGVDGVTGEGVLLGLDRAGISVHSGSACSGEAFEPSPVLKAMGLDADRSLRCSVGWSTSEDDLAAFAEALPKVIASLRALAPSP